MVIPKVLDLVITLRAKKSYRKNILILKLLGAMRVTD